MKNAVAAAKVGVIEDDKQQVEVKYDVRNARVIYDVQRVNGNHATAQVNDARERKVSEKISLI